MTQIKNIISEWREVMSGISLSLVLASTMFLIHANDKVVGTMRYVIIFAADVNIRKEVK